MGTEVMVLERQPIPAAVLAAKTATTANDGHLNTEELMFLYIEGMARFTEDQEILVLQAFIEEAGKCRVREIGIYWSGVIDGLLISARRIVLGTLHAKGLAS